MKLLSNNRSWRFVALLLVCAALTMMRGSSPSAATAAPTSVTIKMRASNYNDAFYCAYYGDCYATPTVTVKVGNTVIGSLAANQDVYASNYRPAEQTLTVTDPAILALIGDPGCSEFAVEASVPTNQYGYILMGYVRVDVTRATGTETTTVVDLTPEWDDSYVGDVSWDYLYNYGVGTQQFKSWATPVIPDNDHDGVNNCSDPDNDNDGVLNAVDNCPLNANASQLDSDLNGAGDACDHEFDRDYDGVWNAVDNCPTKYNPSQSDYDGVNGGDACDTAWDTDRDGIANAVDNCPTDPNSNQIDSNGNGLGDACDGAFDTDGDGIPNTVDNCPSNPNPTQGDSNTDGTGDACSAGVVAVPWLGAEALAHEVYSGGTLVLQAVASNIGTGAAISLASGTWDAGDGSGAQPINVTNSLNLQVEHIYTGADGQPFTATVSVVTSTGATYTDTMKVVIRPNSRDTRVNMAIDKGLWNLHTRMRYTTSDTVASAYWTGTCCSFDMASTASTVQSFEINNHRESGDASRDPYVNDVTRGLRFIISAEHGRLQRFAPSMQNANNPDSDGNGSALGVMFDQNDHTSYVTGQVMDAIVASGTPNKLAVTGQATYVQGRSYRHIIQDMLDGYSWGMADDRGGWYYTFQGVNGSNDTSASHWWAIGVLAARTWNLDAPDWVKNIQKTIGIPMMQAFPGDGHFGYTDSTNSIWDDATNVTAAGLILMNADDMTQDDPRFVAAMGYLYDRFDPALGNSSMGNFYTMYQTTKAMRTAYTGGGLSAPIELLAGTTDWQAAYDDFLVGIQQTNGAFAQTRGTASIVDDMATSWAVIMLSPSLFELPPSAACSASPATIGTHGGVVNFSGAGSFHPDPDKTIASYAWNFGDGSPSATGLTVSHTFTQPTSFPTVRSVQVTVTDSGGMTATSSCPVTIVDTNVPPNAVAGGPYTVCSGGSLLLSGAGSTDEEGAIASYQWDLTSPVNFAAVDATTASVDATTAFASLVPGTYDIGLRVTDGDGAVDSEFTTVTVLASNDPSCNQPPDAVDNSAATLSGTAISINVLSNDTDPNNDTLSVTAATQGSNGSTVVNGDGSITYTPNTGFAGSDTFTYTIGDGHGGSDTATVTVTVTKKTSTSTATGGTFVYDGSAHAGSCSVVGSDGAVLSGTLTYSGGSAPTNVGTTSVTCSFGGAGNYSSSTDEDNIVITLAPSVTVVTCTPSVVYNGAAQEVCTANVTGVGGLNQAVTPVTYAANTNVGTANADATFAGDANHDGSSDGETFTITLAPSVTVVTCTPSVVYNGTAQEVCTANVTGAGGLDQAVSPVTYAANTNVGTANANATFAGDANHDGSSDGETFVITVAPSVTVVTCTPTTVFNGSAQELCTANVTGIGGLNQAVTPVTYAANTNVGTASANATFGGDANHDGSSDGETFTITAAPSVTVVTCTPTTVFNGSAQELCTANVTGIGGLNQAVTPVTYAANTNVGTASANATFGGDANHDGSSDGETFTITAAPSVTVVTCTPTTVFNGSAQELCTANVTGIGGLNQAVTPVTYAANTNVGTASANATFGGDANHDGSSDGETFTITAAPSVTVVTCTPTTVFNGSAQELCTAHVTGVGSLDADVTPVTYADNTNVGTATGSATYAGDANHTTSTGSATFAVTKAPSVTVVTCPVSMEYTGAAVTPCAANVTGAGGLDQAVTPVNYVGNVNVGTGGANAAFAGDDNHTGSNGSTSFAITKKGATVTAGSGTKVFGSADPVLTPTSSGFVTTIDVTETARDAGENVGNYPTHATASGATLDNYDVTYSDGSLAITKANSTAAATGGTFVYDAASHAGSCAFAGVNDEVLTGSLTYSSGAAPVNVGSYTVTCSFAGNGNYNPSSADAPLTITKASSTTVVTCPASVIYTGSALTPCTAHVTGVGGLDQNVTPVTHTANTNVGTATASASYAGDANHSSSENSTTFAITQTATLTSVNAPTITVAANGTVTVTVTSGSGTVIGNVSLTVDGGAAVTQALTGGTSAFTVTSPNAGNHALVATYAAQGNFGASSTTGTLHVNPSPTSTTLAVSAAAQLSGTTVTFTATVAATSPGSGTPNGVVTFKEGTTILGSSTLNASGVATFSTTTLSNGPHTITAVYNGVNNYLPSTSNSVSKLIYGFATGGGTFVIADTEATLNNAVEFWGAQWEKSNVPSGGKSNASFKGFAITPMVPSVGQTFTSAPGNSAPPPAGVPQYLGIIVTSKVTKSGSNITGTIVKLVVVRVDPGYAGNPGHAGTGTIVAFVQ